jgi:hypothetical protein
MADTTENKTEETKPEISQDKDKQHHEEPATPIPPASDEVRPIPASESTKNSK